MEMLQTKFNFNVVPDRRSSDSVKWHAYAEDVLPLWVADMDFLSAEPILEALHARIDHGVFGYPRAMPELLQTIAERLDRLYGWQVEPQEILLLPGVVKGFNLASRLSASQGKAVLVQTPVYHPILQAPENAGTTRQEAALRQAPGVAYAVDWSLFEGAFTEQTGLFILCNPHNPVGRAYRREELERMAEICLQHGVTICSDEIHSDLVYSGNRHIPIASLDPEIARNTITLMSPSKSFNLAGLQASFAVVQNPELRAQLEQAGKGLVGWVNLLGQTAMLAAYRDCQGWLEQLLAYLEGSRDYLVAALRAELPQIPVVSPEGTYLAWLDCRRAGIEGNPFDFFLNKARVALQDGADFGQGGAGFVRLNFGCPRSLLGAAIERMVGAIKVGFEA